jgi:hypothetical protein
LLSVLSCAVVPDFGASPFFISEAFDGAAESLAAEEGAAVSLDIEPPELSPLGAVAAGDSAPFAPPTPCAVANPVAASNAAAATETIKLFFMCNRSPQQCGSPCPQQCLPARNG